ncbi:transposase [Spirosoma fluviale]|uniref:REP element-mobilizing transposase RayT n=1 Tax=Spirosoma fluviale TaxID=1597977 RepID=A0A286FB70_9BACT|nr:transposase [Spirosoma fluviale]SOD80475.1 REP element-mobilizing transposase RayT [Spirosoma fluviale]
MDDLYQNNYRVPSARLVEYDYGSNGMYFVTICTRKKEFFFGDVDVETARIKPTLIGQVAMDCWLSIPDFFPFVLLDAFQLMPNHVHGVLWICKPETDTPNWQPNRFGPQRQNLASILRGFKAGVKKYATMHKIDFGWQPRYYDRVVRNNNELNRIRAYIENNPAKWIDECNNPESLYM